MRTLGWAEVEALVEALAEQLRPIVEADPDPVIVGIARGGLVPATMLAHRLGVRSVLSLGLASYADGARKAGWLEAYGPIPDRATVIVDDLVETGSSIDRALTLFPDAVGAVLLNKALTKRARVHAAETANPTEWVEFPWES